MLQLLNAKDESAERAAGFLRTVAHVGRLRIVCALIDGERNAGELARDTGLTAPALSQQAAVLETRGIIARRRAGRSVSYRLAAPEAKALAKFLYKMFCHKTAAPRRRTLNGEKT